MANYKVKLDLAKLCNVQAVDVQGKKCVVIPVDDNGIFLSQKGGIYLDLVARENTEPKYGQTHYIKRNVSKKTFAEMSNDARDSVKNIVGNLAPFEFENNTAPQTPTPVSQIPETKKTVDVSELPF